MQHIQENMIRNLDELPHNTLQYKLRIYATIFIFGFGISYAPLEWGAGLGPIKVLLMGISTLLLCTLTFAPSNAFICGLLYLGYQFFSASFHPETWRWSTLLFSAGFVFTYICFYNMLYVKQVFSIDYFIEICKKFMQVFFIVCIFQQLCILAGIRNLSLLNLTFLNRGIGCSSLSMEPSSFARTMLVFYYAYIKCCEYRRGKGPFSVKELLSNEHKWVTLRFLWMMLTMGSGTAFVCLIALSLYFVRKSNFLIMVPILIAAYIGIEYIEFKPLQRATTVIEATSSFDRQTVIEADGSAAHRIAPVINSLYADFTKAETWFGKGVDWGKNNETFIRLTGTLFDDYGFIFYLLTLLLDFSCAYKFFSLGTVFMFMGIAGGAGGNIHYSWFLMMIMTGIRYFNDNYNHLERKKDFSEPFNKHLKK